MDYLIGKDKSILTIQNTSPLVPSSGGIWDMIIDDWSQLYFSGGYVNRLDLGGHARAEISGGQINKLSSGYIPSTSPWIEIVCKDWDYSTTTKILTGTWGDNSAFNIQLIDVAGYTSTYSNIEFTVIPEPSAMLLLGLGGLLIRRK
jgi:hypothetical protein